jgi:hypothetical protein
MASYFWFKTRPAYDPRRTVRQPAKRICDKVKSFLEISPFRQMSSLFRKISPAWRDSLEEYVLLWSTLQLNVVSLLIIFPMLILMIPSYLIVLPLDSVLFPATYWTKVRGWITMVAVQIVAIIVIFSPRLVLNALESRYQTNELCQVCGRPGNLIEYGGRYRKKFLVFCSSHIDSAPTTTSGSRASREVVTPSSGASTTVLFTAILWVASVFFAAIVSPGHLRKMVLILVPIILVIFGILYFSNQEIVSTLFSQ